jgi:hypothetical protein
LASPLYFFNSWKAPFQSGGGGGAFLIDMQPLFIQIVKQFKVIRFVGFTAALDR